MKKEEFPLEIIRSYHNTLLSLVKTIRGYKEMIREDDFMDIKWKCSVARNLVGVEADAREVIEKIGELREEYNCVSY